MQLPLSRRGKRQKQDQSYRVALSKVQMVSFSQIPIPPHCSLPISLTWLPKLDFSSHGRPVAIGAHSLSSQVLDYLNTAGKRCQKKERLHLTLGGTIFFHREGVDILPPTCVDGQYVYRRWNLVFYRDGNDFCGLQGKLGNVIFQQETDSKQRGYKKGRARCCSCFLLRRVFVAGIAA